MLICKGTGKRGHIVADTLLLMMFPDARKLGNICCGHKMFLNKIRNSFCVPDTKYVSATNVTRWQAGKHLCRQQSVRNNVSSFASTFKVLWSGFLLFLSVKTVGEIEAIEPQGEIPLKQKLKIKLERSSRFLDNAEFGHFLRCQFCKRRQRNVPRIDNARASAIVLLH